MSRNRIHVGKKYELAKTSLLYQTKEYFENSTLHGVRYIAEEGRPPFDRFLWICCTLVGATVTLIIIVSLWEKFQTNPTITGLDTDFHNWDVEFPGVTLCQDRPVKNQSLYNLIQSNFSYVKDQEGLVDYLEIIGGLNHLVLKYMPDNFDPEFPTTNLRQIALQISYRCEDIISNCMWKDEPASNEECCQWFQPTFTETGLCFAFNIRPSTGIINWNGDVLKSDNFIVKAIYETDPSWGLTFSVKDAEDNPVSIFIESADELPGIDINAQHVWDTRISKIAFSAKTTYTTEDTRQLSVRQRHCVFPDEITLISDHVYTYGGCMRDCRIKLSKKYCNCIPYFYKPLIGYEFCDLKGYLCLAKNHERIFSKTACVCELSCQNTVYEVEKLTEHYETTDEKKVELLFVSWPMIRYKREVLFGWVDLLVSFGGIAGLFLGFSLLSGVEIIYYFTMRACCMLNRDKKTLEEFRQEYELAPKPPLDLSMTPYFMRNDDKQPITPTVQNVQPRY